MFPLDPRTIERLAAVIVDSGGQYERKGWELERLLRDAGWADPPEYDHSAKVPWLVDQMWSRRENWADLERLLARACDPLEYDDGMVAAEEFRLAINERLEPEQLVVTYVGGRPAVGELGADGSTAVFSEPPDLEHRLRRLIADETTVRVLLRRIGETRICEQGGAHTMAVIGIGSVVEGMLLALLQERDERVRDHQEFIDRDGRTVRERQPRLETLIDTAHARGWIQLDAKNFIHAVRNFRNFIHPRKELAELPDFDADSVKLCWAPVHAVLNDLEERMGGQVL
ncbi:hypothetical protein EV191_105114 [Tamaricihabitans halophyticus]|uniref:DUF4145 domain-containing protein n=1 Tax=Tamaricihabitans halophyticus TaxID=1262583 RepID=A0A4R2R0S8_9PSEU|nr:hypothetical protein [Tamaricihabitans halophyticus]TCP53051.1 hypothetical protein EV191_105114 [Tamaricihabitans halophyticus]